MFAFIEQMRTDGSGAESACEVLRMRDARVASRTYRAWKSCPAPPRAFSETNILDIFQPPQTRHISGRRNQTLRAPTIVLLPGPGCPRSPALFEPSHAGTHDPLSVLESCRISPTQQTRLRRRIRCRGRVCLSVAKPVAGCRLDFHPSVVLRAIPG